MQVFEPFVGDLDEQKLDHEFVIKYKLLDVFQPWFFYYIFCSSKLTYANEFHQVW